MLTRADAWIYFAAAERSAGVWTYAQTVDNADRLLEEFDKRFKPFEYETPGELPTAEFVERKHAKK